MSRLRVPFTRHRERGQFSDRNYLYRSWNYPNGLSGASWKTGKKESITDVVTPGFYQLSGEGKVIMSPCTISSQLKQSTHLSSGVGYISNPSQWWRYEGATPDTMWCFGGSNPSTTSSIIGALPLLHVGSGWQDLRVEASTRCLSNIGRSSVDNWENIAEARKTLSMLWNPLSSWYRFERNALAKTQAESAANAWLTYRYGIRPLVSSIMDTIKALQKEMRTSRRLTSRGEAQNTMSVTTNWTVNDGAAIFTNTKTISETIRARATSIDEVVADLPSDIGLGSKSLLTLPWELVPYSFVVDWFLNVGDVLGSIVESFHRRNLGAVLVYSVEQIAVQQSLSQQGLGAVVVTSPELALITETCVSKIREVGLETAGLVIKADFRLGDLTRLADAVALVGQQLLNRFGRKG